MTTRDAQRSGLLRQFRTVIASIRTRLTPPEAYARRLGVRIGRDCRISTRSWGSEPWLIEIGDHVHVTSGVSFVNHDGGVWVFRNEMPDFYVFGRIRIGDNTYIGNDTMILPGVTIGADCVIGARSLVNKDVPDGTVAAGVPVRLVSTTAEYKAKMLPLRMRARPLTSESLPLEKEIRREVLR